MPSNSQPVTRIAIVGAGNVGATFAFSLLMDGLASEIVLIDMNRERAEGESMDLNHGMPFMPPARVWAGDYSDCEGAEVIVLTAGSAQRPGETRLDLLKRNASVFQTIVPAVLEQTKDAILLVATNPVDVLTYVVSKVSGLSPARVIGSGTILDTARFRYLISRRLNLDSRSTHASIIGEHGDSQVPLWSLATVAGMKLEDYCLLNGCEFDEAARNGIAESTRRAAYEIIQRKGATYYAIAAGLVRIVQAIARNESSVLTVSSRLEESKGLGDVCLSLPSIVGRAGIERVLNMPLSPTERTALKNSARIIQQAIAEIQ